MSIDQTIRSSNTVPNNDIFNTTVDQTINSTTDQSMYVYSLTWCIRISLIGAMLALNSAGLTLMLRAMHRSSTNLAVAINQAISFMLSGLIGWLVFDESIDQMWLIGVSIVCVGVALLTSTQQETSIKADWSTKSYAITFGACFNCSTWSKICLLIQWIDRTLIWCSCYRVWLPGYRIFRSKRCNELPNQQLRGTETTLTKHSDNSKSIMPSYFDGEMSYQTIHRHALMPLRLSESSLMNVNVLTVWRHNTIEFWISSGHEASPVVRLMDGSNQLSEPYTSAHHWAS